MLKFDVSVPFSESLYYDVWL